MLVAALGTLLAALGTVAAAYELMTGDDADVYLWLAATLLGFPATGACLVATGASYRFARSADGGRAARWWFFAAYVLWGVWSVPATGLWGTFALVLYSPFFVAGVAAALLAGRLWSGFRRTGV